MSVHEPEITEHSATIVLRNTFCDENSQYVQITNVTLSHYYDYGGFKHSLESDVSISPLGPGDTVSLAVKFKTGAFAPTDSWTLSFMDQYGDQWSTDGYNNARLNSSNIDQEVNVNLDGPWFSQPDTYQTFVQLNSDTITAFTPNYPGSEEFMQTRRR